MPVPVRDRSEVWWLVLVMLVGFFLAVASHYVLGVYLHKRYPYNTFLFDPVHPFGDLAVTLRAAANPSPYVGVGAFRPSGYFPFANLLIKPLTWLPYGHAAPLYLLGTTATILWVLAAQLRDADLPLRLVTACVIGLLNYPVLLMLDRGNVEGLILLLLTGSALTARRGAWKWSAVLIGAAAAMKGYPLLFVLVLVGARRYRDVLIAAVTAVALTLVSLMTFAGGVAENVRGMLSSLDAFFAFNSGELGVQHGSSLNGLASALAHMAPSLTWLHQTVAPISLGVLIIGAAGVASGRLLLWQSYAVVAALTILVPTVAFDYRLVLLLVPVILLLREPGGSLRRSSVLLLGLLFVPKGLPVLYGQVTLGVVVNPLLLLLLVVGLTSMAVRQRPAMTGSGSVGDVVPKIGGAALSRGRCYREASAVPHDRPMR